MGTDLLAKSTGTEVDPLQDVITDDARTRILRRPGPDPHLHHLGGPLRKSDGWQESQRTERS